MKLRKKGAGCRNSRTRNPGYILSSGMAWRQLNRDTAVTADVLMCQVDHITSIARHTSMVTTRLAALPCESVLQQMTENGALTPYIRSTGLIRDGIVICSSVTGVRQQSADEIFGVAVSAPREANYHSHGGTSSVPGHVAVIYAYGACSGAKALMRCQRPDGRSISPGGGLSRPLKRKI